MPPSDKTRPSENPVPTFPRDANIAKAARPYIYADPGIDVRIGSLRIHNLGYYPCKHVEVAQRFPIDALVLVTEGKGTFWKGTRPVPIVAPVYFFVRKGKYSRYAPDADGWEERFVSFCGTRVAEWKRLGWITPAGVINPLPNFVELAELHEFLARDFASGEPLRIMRSHLAVERLVFEVHAGRLAATASGGLDDPLARVLDHWRANPRLAAAGPRAAAAAGMSYSTFRARFQERYGTTPARRLLLLRISLSCEALCSSQRAVKEIAYDAGFTHIESFNRAFRRIMGTSPREFREMQRALLP